jgi:multiple sugar transport system ATP-binding protein
LATVSLRNIVKSFRGVFAVHDLTLDIFDKEFLVLLGPSGCGKTTTMRIIAGLESPSAGDILIDGVRVNDQPARDRDLAMVFQNYGLYPHMTVSENIGYPLKVKRVPKGEREARVTAAASRVELDGLLHRRPAELSGGQRQRVALARAIVRTPRLFLMDEPLSNLDSKLRTVMRAQLKRMQRDLATTTIYVTHDQIEAMTLADRIVVMKEGRIQQIGAPAEVYSRPTNTFVAAFIGSPPMNLIPGEIADGCFRCESGAVAVASKHCGKVLLGVRPEDARTAGSDQGQIHGKVFSSELLGDSSLIGVMMGSTLINVKVAAQDGLPIDASVGLNFDSQRLHLFDAATGDRIPGATS